MKPKPKRTKKSAVMTDAKAIAINTAIDAKPESPPAATRFLWAATHQRLKADLAANGWRGGGLLFRGDGTVRALYRRTAGDGRLEVDLNRDGTIKKWSAGRGTAGTDPKSLLAYVAKARD